MTKTNSTEKKINICYLGDDNNIKKFLNKYKGQYNLFQTSSIGYFFKIKQVPDIMILDSRIKSYRAVIKYLNHIKKYYPLFICLIYTKDINKKMELLSYGIENIFIIPEEYEEFKLSFPQYIIKIKNQLQYKNIISQLDIMNSSLEIILNTIDADFSLMERIINILVFGLISSFKEAFIDLPEYLLLGRQIQLKEKGFIFHLYKIRKNGLPELKQIFFEKYNNLNLDLYFFQQSSVNYTKHIKNKIQSPILKKIQKKINNIKDILYFIDENIIIAAFNNRDINELIKFTFHTFAIQAKLLNLIELNTKKLKHSYSYTVQTLARAAEASDELTGDHISRVGYYSIYIANKMGFPKSFSETILSGAKLHDIGKIHIPDHILQKRTFLTKEEWEIMKKHTIFGAYIIGDSDFLKDARIIALQHHENYDGTGYPYNLSKEEIDIKARIVKLADVYDSLRSPRPYKEEFSHKKALKIILEGDNRVKPSHFDPEVLKIFEKYHKNFDIIYESLKY